MQAEESPVSSPDVECYEECVVAEDGDSSPSVPASASNGRLSSSNSAIARVNKDVGRVCKKSELVAPVI